MFDLPFAGILGEVEWPEGVRVDTWVETGAEVTPYYDSLLAKLMVYAPTRKEAIAKLADALKKTKVLHRRLYSPHCPRKGSLLSTFMIFRAARHASQLAALDLCCVSDELLLELHTLSGRS